MIRRRTTVQANERQIHRITVNLASEAAQSSSDSLSFVLSSFFPWEWGREQLALISCHRPYLVLKFAWGNFLI